MLASEIVDRICRELGAIGLGDAASAEEQEAVLSCIQTMLDGWSLKRINVPYSTRESLALIAGTNPYTIGSDVLASFNTGRPVHILSAYLSSGGVDYPLDVTMTEEYYNTLSDKATQAMPSKLWYDKQFPLGKIWFNCPPDAAYTLLLSSTKVLNTADLKTNPETDLAFPPGYERAIIFNGCIESAGVLRKTPKDTTVAIAQASFDAVKAANVKIGTHRFDVGAGGMFTSWRR